MFPSTCSNILCTIMFHKDVNYHCPTIACEWLSLSLMPLVYPIMTLAPGFQSTQLPAECSKQVFFEYSTSFPVFSCSHSNLLGMCCRNQISSMKLIGSNNTVFALCCQKKSSLLEYQVSEFCFIYVVHTVWTVLECRLLNVYQVLPHKEIEEGVAFYQMLEHWFNNITLSLSTK